MVGRSPVPCFNCVAVQAGCGITGACVFFLIVPLVATHTVGLVRRIKDGRATVGGMAIRTRQFLMGPNQLVPAGYLGMIEALSVPGTLAMAEQAGGRVSGSRMFFLIVGLVASHTVLLTLGIEEKSAAREVARAALSVLVGTSKLVPARELRMVERSNVQPGLGSVTGEAFCGEPESDVIDTLRRLVVLRVACQAVSR